MESETKFKCRVANCNKVFAKKTNRHRQEKKKNHLPPKRRSNVTLPVYDKVSKNYHCPITTYKGNIMRHFNKGCDIIAQRKNKKKITRNVDFVNQLHYLEMKS